MLYIYVQRWILSRIQNYKTVLVANGTYIVQQRSPDKSKKNVDVSYVRRKCFAPLNFLAANYTVKKKEISRQQFSIYCTVFGILHTRKGIILYRVPEFLSCRLNFALNPSPPPRESVSPQPWVLGRGRHTRLRGWG